MESEAESSVLDDTIVLFPSRVRNGSSHKSEQNGWVNYKGNRIHWLTQLVDNIAPNSPRHILACNSICIVATELMDFIQFIIHFESNHCISRPLQASTSISEDWEGLISIGYYNPLECVCLHKDNNGWPLLIIVLYVLPTTLVDCPDWGTLFHSATNIQIPLTLDCVLCWTYLFTLLSKVGLVVVFFFNSNNNDTVCV